MGGLASLFPGVFGAGGPSGGTAGPVRPGVLAPGGAVATTAGSIAKGTAALLTHPHTQLALKATSAGTAIASNIKALTAKPPPPPKKDDKKVQDARRRQLARARKGKNQTVLTGTQTGSVSRGGVQKNTLLGR